MRKSIIFNVLGSRCSNLSQNNIKEIQSQLEERYEMPCEVICNPSFGNTLKNIGKTICHIPPSKSSTTVRSLYSKVIRHLNQGYNVIVFGHSYGGSVASRVAEILHDRQIRTNRLLIVTFGSIYVPNPNRTQGVNIRHVMFDNDVALRCNHLKRSRDSFVDWRDHKLSHIKSKWYNVSNIEFKIHKDYGSEIKLPLIKNFLNKQKNIRNIPKNAPRIFSGPRPKKIEIKIKSVNIQNYPNIYKKIKTLTNIPGAYNLRKKLISNLGKEIRVYDFIGLKHFKPYFTKNYYYLKYGKDPKQWLFLLPDSYNMLRRSGPTFKHFVLRNSAPNLRVANFKRVSRLNLNSRVPQLVKKNSPVIKKNKSINNK